MQKPCTKNVIENIIIKVGKGAICTSDQIAGTVALFLFSRESLSAFRVARFYVRLYKVIKDIMMLL